MVQIVSLLRSCHQMISFKSRLGIPHEDSGLQAEASNDVFNICQLENQDYRAPFSHPRFILACKIIADEITPLALMFDEIIPTVSIHCPILAGENCVCSTSCQTTQCARLPKDSHQSECN